MQILSRNATVDDLSHRSVALIGHEIEGCGFGIGALDSLPCQIFFGQLRELGRLVGDRLNGGSAIFGFLRPGDVGQSGQ